MKQAFAAALPSWNAAKP